MKPVYVIRETGFMFSQAVAQAKENLTDLNERETDVAGGNVLEFMEGILTQDEITGSELWVSIIGEK